MTDEFQLKGLLPFFATFIHQLGFEVSVTTGADRSALRRGIEEANIPFCAPVQHYRGWSRAWPKRAPTSSSCPCCARSRT